MLRNRSRAVTSKQALMADHSSQPSHTQNLNKKPPPFFVSQRFRAFTQKGFSENEGLVSPTSILDTRTFSHFTNPFSSYNRRKTTAPRVFSGNKRPWDNPPEAKGIGLVLIDPIFDDEKSANGEKNLSKVLLGNKLRVQIPPLSTCPLSPSDDHNQSPKSPAEFGIKTRNSHVSACGSANSCGQTKDIMASPRSITGWISVSDVENSEDYTCVISHGPVPRTTHIFDNCIVESYCCLSDNKKPNSFLSFCHTCNKNLEQKIDIYIYRGEKAFCSRECRYQEMVLDGLGNAEFDDAVRKCF